ncbi:tetratricopeptide repeat protein [Solimicrobium silvestre]|uniref:Sel1 repeat n=1 Tax=Solimicrobium silvestre TaxID=2099400 RepID=A0A2S9GVR0_9BURK|nr:tetratricopeptide repeat protein [Solimicrobium silvestre]PRC91815.1 Sel1 repeat [Solimicrobium silvestre]
MKKFLTYIFWVCLVINSNTASADWFVSSETKALILKADLGDINAQIKVAVAYDLGKGAPKDIDNAKKYYKMAAEQGNAEAQNSLGSVLQSEKHFADAMPWYEKASAQGHAQATNNLAYLYDLGLGVSQDRHKGFELYSRAAELGWAESMWNIANMYMAGQLGEPDMVMGCVWTIRANRFASADAPKLKNYLAHVVDQFQHRLSEIQFNTCKTQGEDWEPSLAKAEQNRQPRAP